MLPALAQTSDLAARAGREGPDLTRYVVACALLLVVLGLLAWGMRALVAGSVRARAGRRSLQVLDVLPLGGKQRVCVVRCYDRTFALGVGDKEVGLIAELDAAVSAPQPSATGARAPFRDVFARLRGQSPAATEVLQ
jgi:flagellar biogenesis protein FliO